MRTRPWLAALALALPLSMAACGGSGDTEDQPELTVLAAASLTDAFEDLAASFEAEHDATVTFSFGSSTDLAEQAADGAPGDVLATADETSMRAAEDAGVTGDVEQLATNVLVIVTPAGNPAGVTGLGDLAGTTWVRCADEVPCGRIATAVLADHGVSAEPASLEDDVRATLDKVASGEAQAGLVYETDAVAAGDTVEAVPIAGAGDFATTYFVADLEQAQHPDLAAAWVDLVTSDAGQQVLAKAGFGRP